jgi:putative transposase
MSDRKSIRLRNYDYSQPGMYYVTLCVRNRGCVLGKMVKNEMILSAMGEIVRDSWENIPKHFKNAALDRYVIMPNHMHGIVMLKESLVGTRHAVSPQENENLHQGAPLQKYVSPQGISNFRQTEKCGKPIHGSLSTIMRSFKSAASKRIHSAGQLGFDWQSRFYEHVIRDGNDLDRIRRYILDNPTNWLNDENFPQNIRMDRTHDGPEDWSALD